MRILLVEDDVNIGQGVEYALRTTKHQVHWVLNGLVASKALVRHDFDLVLMDLGLPQRDGLGVLSEVRARGDEVPVILITARDSVEDRILGLNKGADDYLGKPFHMAELLARIGAIARRRAARADRVLSNGLITLDTATKEANVSGTSVALSRREFALLRELLDRPGAILSRAQLEDRIYGAGQEIESNAIDFIIHGLRKKLGPQAIRNVRGLGWNVERGM